MPDSGSLSLADRIENLLPQTQCTKCGYAGCRPYAEAIAAGQAGYNQCPPGGAEGIARLAHLLGKPVIALNPANGTEHARAVAVIDEALCIGCTLCMQACPVDAIIGAPRQMHTVISALCTGCDLCVAPCPVDCIAMVPVTGDATGWQAWSQRQADEARARHAQRGARLARERDAARARAAARRANAETASHTPDTTASSAESGAEAKKRAIIAAALARARQKKAEPAMRGEGPRDAGNASANAQAQITATQAHHTQAGSGQVPDDKPSTDRRAS